MTSTELVTTSSDSVTTPSTTTPPPASFACEDMSQVRKKLHIIIEPWLLAQEWTNALTQLQKDSTAPGFRKGKLPLPLVAKYHYAKAYQKALNNAVDIAYNYTLKQSFLVPLSQPEIDLDKADEASLFAPTHPVQPKPTRFAATLDVRPKLLVTGYQGLHLEVPETLADTANFINKKVDEALEHLSKQHGEPDMPHAVNDALAEKAGFKTIDELRSKIENQAMDILNQERLPYTQDRINDLLLQTNETQVPESALEQATTEILGQNLEDRQAQEGVRLSAEEAENFTTDPENRASVKDQAIQKVQLTFILASLAEQEKIQADSQKVMQNTFQIWQSYEASNNTKASKKSPDKTIQVFQNIMQHVTGSLTQQAVYHKILELAHFTASTEQPVNAT